MSKFLKISKKHLQWVKNYDILNFLKCLNITKLISKPNKLIMTINISELGSFIKISNLTPEETKQINSSC